MRIRGGGHPSSLGCKPDLFMGCSVRGGGEGLHVCVSVAKGEGWGDNDGG